MTSAPSAALGRRRALLYALVFAMVFMWMTGAISRWGQWYSDQPFYRAQVYAFFHGRLALSHQVEGVTHDLVWVDGGVQQVWGLGVPMWQSLWEAIGHLINLTPFPDRIAMLFGIVLAAYALLRAWLGPTGDRTPASRGAFLITALMPGIVAMMRGRIAVYEEAELYSYGTTMLLVVGMIAMLRRPSTAKYCLLLAFAGATGLVRPTVWFFGAGTAALATILYIKARGSLRRALPTVAIASLLFLAGGGALYLTNYLRFGRGSEFGHRLNLEDLPGNIYATRFGYPFETVPTSEAVKELAGGMFGRPELRAPLGFRFYEKHLHQGESPAPRWREYYFTTYTYAFIPMIVGGIALSLVAWLRWRRAKQPPASGAVKLIEGPALDRESRWLGAWALLGATPLLVFYLRSPSVSSRYFLDIAPAFSVLIAIAWRHLAAWLRPRGFAGVAFLAFAVFWLWSDIYFTTRRSWLSPLRSRAAEDTMLARVEPFETRRPVPDAYDITDPWLGVYVGGDQWLCKCYEDIYNEQACDHFPYGSDTDVKEVHSDEERVIVKRIDHDVPPLEVAGGEWPTACTLDNPDPEPPEALPVEPERTIEQRFATVALYRNGTNWDLTSGGVGVATYLFVDDPEFVEVEVGPYSWKPPGPEFVAEVRAKVMLEELPLVSAVSTPRGARLRFAGPTIARYQHGLQVVFLAFGPPDQLDAPASAYKLLRVAWHAPGRAAL